MPGRAFRLEKIIQQTIGAGEKFDFEKMRAMQLDQRDEYVAEVLPKLLRRLSELRKIWSSLRT